MTLTEEGILEMFLNSIDETLGTYNLQSGDVLNELKKKKEFQEILTNQQIVERLKNRLKHCFELMCKVEINSKLERDLKLEIDSLKQILEGKNE